MIHSAIQSPSMVPRFKTNLQLIALGESGFCVLSEYDTFLLEGPGICVVVPLVNGRRSVAEICTLAYCTSGLPKEQVGETLSLLLNTGYIEDAFASSSTAFGSMCGDLGMPLVEASALIQNRPIRLINLTSSPQYELVNLLHASGIVFAERSFLSLVLCDDYRDPEIGVLCRQFGIESHPWLLSKPHGHNFWIGPFFNTKLSPCWHCLDHRLSLNREMIRYAERSSGYRQVVRLNVNTMQSSLVQAHGSLTNQVLRILLDRFSPTLTNHLCIVDTLNLTTTWHYLVKRPECLACGIPSGNNTAAVLMYEPSDSSLSMKSLAGKRREAPEMTFERFKHHISSVTGIVRFLTPSNYNFSSPLRIYSAGHNFALGSDMPATIRDSIRALSSGKGRTDSEARTSALCEALERYSGLFQGSEIKQRASHREIANEAIDPAECMLFSKRQYEERERWLSQGSRFQVVPCAFDYEAPIDWSPVKNLCSSEMRYLPTSYLYYGFPYDHSNFYCWADSNGCAAGTSFDDACLQGMLELIERDAVALWWYNRYQVPAVDIESFDDEYYMVLKSYYRSIGREYWVLDLTNDFGIPVYCAVNRRDHSSTEDIVMGFGAHLDPAIALNRAVTEMNQFMPAVLAQSADGTTLYSSHDKTAQNWWRHGRLSKELYLQPDTKVKASKKSSSVSSNDLSIGTMLREVTNRIRKQNLDIFFLDQTRAEIGIPVVKMIVPGMRHFWARFAQGRLYDVPVKMGILEKPSLEDNLNPYPMFV